jgi:hypothetical protein
MRITEEDMAMHDCHASPEDGCTACNAWEQQQDEARVCPEDACDGSGLVQKFTYDSEMHTYLPDGEEDCVCADSTDSDSENVY